MLTRFEVSGFKNLRDVVVDFGPFTCIAGQNGVGKSNLFDAIQFLSHLASGTFREAIASVRPASGQRATQESVLSAAVLAGEENLRLAAEMVIPSQVRDNRGRSTTLPDQCLRYEVELRVDTSYQGKRARPIRLVSERLTSSTRSLPEPLAGVADPRPGKGRVYIDTTELPVGFDADGEPQDLGPGASMYAMGMKASVVDLDAGDGSLASMHVSDDYLLDELDRTVLSHGARGTVPGQAAAELESWRFIALEPSLIRAMDSVDAPGELEGSGAHLAAFLNAQAEEQGREVYDALRHALWEIIDLRDLDVVRNGDFLELRAQAGDGPLLPARALSDGTLRMLVLGALATTTQPSGAIFLEEPENGVHPGRLHALLDLLRRMSEPQGDALRQVVVNTHSPYVVREIADRRPEDIVCAVRAKRAAPGGGLEEHAVFRPLPGTWRAEGWEEGRGTRPVSRGQLSVYLSSPQEWEIDG
ncbi:AAA family ATPase [Actinomyces slackii]|uniref:Recombination protein F n=1 Tax=Actinomyces slackii TaxID=52774 RepID=A0A448KFH5_9ACTO|nr:ATP-binding protein [Actinomyces slackii]VEG75717.1 recombination protein F [Actinomyces slackii]